MAYAGRPTVIGKQSRYAFVFKYDNLHVASVGRS